MIEKNILIEASSIYVIIVHLYKAYSEMQSLSWFSVIVMYTTNPSYAVVGGPDTFDIIEND